MPQVRIVVGGALLASALVMGCGTAPAAVDASTATDAATPSDTGASFVAMTLVSSLNENCMPAVPPDPLPIAGMIQVTNTGAVPLGPIHVDRGLVVQLLGGETVASFDVAPIDLPVLAPGQTSALAFSKTDGSLHGAAGASGCDIVACGSAVRIALLLSGPGVPDGARASSEPLTVSCAF